MCLLLFLEVIDQNKVLVDQSKEHTFSDIKLGFHISVKYM